ncbi:MAG TPA: alpha-ketoacid dehydrogenase subunit beta [Candidatus Brocadiia bacterium]|nr:alpha-ketoacid dehydrogenase subunit beta [Candidatus Brocadiia bacterium]
MREITYARAIREALAQEMRRDPNVFCMGEDIALYGGAFKVTEGLLDEFGPERVRNTPISEGSITGVATGAAMLGMRPVLELMFCDFLALAADQILNHAAKFRHVYGQQVRVPLTIRTPSGGGRGYGPTHSQSLETWFMRVPGLKIACPASSADAKGLLTTAIRDDNPVLFIENKMLYSLKGDVPEGEHLVPFGKAAILRRGDDLTIAAYSRMSVESLKAASILAGEGISAEVIDLRTLCPLDVDTVVASAQRTGRLLIVEEGTITCGLGAELGFRVFERIWDYLECPPRRLACPDVPIPCNTKLEAAILPSAVKIVDEARAMMEAG